MSKIGYCAACIIGSILITMAAAAFMLSISNTNDVEAAETAEELFAKVYRYKNTDIVYDTETKVMYAVSDGVDNRGDFCVLVNADGTPKLYSE